MGPVLGPHARTDRTRDTRVAEPRPPAPEGGRLGEGQRLTPDAPHNSGRPPPPGDGPPPPRRHAAPTGHAGQGDSVGRPHPQARNHSMWVADPNSPPSGRAVRGGGAPDHRCPSQRRKAPPREHPSATSTASNAGPQGRTLSGRCWVPRPHRRHPGHTGRRTPATRPGGRAAGGGTAPDTRLPSQRWQAIPPGDGPPPAPRHAAPTGHAGQGDSVGPPHPHNRAHSTWVADPNSAASGRAVGGGGAPDLRRPSERWKAPPPGTSFHHPHSEQRRPARAHAVEPVLGPHAHTDRTRNTRVAVPRLPAPEDGRSGEGQRLTPDAPHNSGRPPPPRGRPPTTPAARSPHRACRPSQVGRNRDPTAPPPEHTRRSKGPGQDTRRGTDHVERPYQRPVPGPRQVRTPHHPGGGGADAAGARAHAHAKGTRKLPEGQPERARGTHRPPGMAYQRARLRDTRTGSPATRSAGHAGREGGNGRDTTPGTGPTPRTGRERRAHTDGALHPPRQ